MLRHTSIFSLYRWSERVPFFCKAVSKGGGAWFYCGWEYRRTANKKMGFLMRNTFLTRFSWVKKSTHYMQSSSLSSLSTLHTRRHIVPSHCPNRPFLCCCFSLPFHSFSTVILRVVFGLPLTIHPSGLQPSVITQSISHSLLGMWVKMRCTKESPSWLTQVPKKKDTMEWPLFILFIVFKCLSVF